MLGDANLRERAGETEPMNQAEAERDDPGVALREHLFAVAHADDFRGEEHDAERDHGLGRSGREVHDA